MIFSEVITRAGNSIDMVEGPTPPLGRPLERAATTEPHPRGQRNARPKLYVLQGQAADSRAPFETNR